MDTQTFKRNVANGVLREAKKECHTLSREDVNTWLGLDVMSVDYCGKVWCMRGESIAKGSIKTMVHFDKFCVVVEHNMITCKFTTVADNYHGPGSINRK